MAMFTHVEGRKREPLGGKAVDGFGPWLEATHKEVTQAVDLLRRKLPADNVGLYVGQSAHRDYAQWLHLWKLLERGRSPHVAMLFARDDFEVRLIANVMGTFGGVEYARRVGPKRIEGGGRPMADVDAAYERACLVLARYAGIDPKRVKECGGDQAKLTELGAGR